MINFTVTMDEKDLATLKLAAKERHDSDGQPWSTGRLVRYILSAWLSANQAKEKKGEKHERNKVPKM